MTIKRFVLLACVVAWFGKDGTAQSSTCSINGSFSSATNGSTKDNRLNSTGACINWRLTYQSTGFSALSISIQGAPDSSGTAGTFADVSSTYVVQGSNPSTLLQGEVAIAQFFPWMRVKVNSTTGSGTITYNLNGVNATVVLNRPGSGGGSSTAGVTSFNSRTGAVTPASGDYTCADVTNCPTAVYTTVQEEGSSLTQRSTINFVGAGVTAADSSGKTTVTIPGSTGGGGVVDVLSEAKAGGTLNSAKKEGSSLAASGTLTLLDISPGSAGYLSHMFIAFTNSDAAARTDSTLKITVDGETAGDTFNSRIPLYFGAEYCYNTVNYSSRWNGCQQNGSDNIGFYSYIPIPFSTSLKIELINGSASTASTVWANFTYQTGVANTWPNTRKLRTASGTLTNQTVDTLETLVDAQGISPGRLFGVFMSIDSFPNTANPLTGPLEGNVAIYVDNSMTPSLESSGTEDYFNWSNYFEGKSTLYGSTSTSGNFSYDQGYTGIQFSTVISPATWNVYRYHVMDQVLFNNGIKVTWQCGDSTQVNFTGGVRVAWMIWYYTE